MEEHGGLAGVAGDDVTNVLQVVFAVTSGPQRQLHGAFVVLCSDAGFEFIDFIAG